MIPDWLPASERRAFVDEHLGRQPYARAGAAASSVGLLDWAAFDRVLAPRDGPDVLTVRGGVLAEVPPPRSVRAETSPMMALSAPHGRPRTRVQLVPPKPSEFDSARRSGSAVGRSTGG